MAARLNQHRSEIDLIKGMLQLSSARELFIPSGRRAIGLCMLSQLINNTENFAIYDIGLINLYCDKICCLTYLDKRLDYYGDDFIENINIIEFGLKRQRTRSIFLELILLSEGEAL